MIGLIRRIGYLQNCIKGNESAAFQMLHLVIGVFGGMPGYLVSLRVTLAFYLSFLFEVPSGVIADMIGHARAMAYGCIFQSAACLVVLLSMVLGQEGADLVLVILSSFFSALSGALSSGSFQALIQDIIDKDAQKLTGRHAASFRLKALSLSEAYGAWFSALFPMLILGFFFWLQRVSSNAPYLLLVPAITYAGLGLYFYRLVLDGSVCAAGCSIREAFSSYRRSLANARQQLLSGTFSGQYEFLLLAGLLICGSLLMIHVHTYLLVAQFREIVAPNMSVRAMLEMFLMLVAFDLAHLLKGWLVPRLTLRYPPSLLVRLSYAGLIFIALAAYMALKQGVGTLALIIFVLLFRAVLLLGQNIIQSALLSRCTERARATVISAIQGVVILLYGTYSLYLTIIGIESAGRILTEVIIVASIGLGGSILLGTLAKDSVWDLTECHSASAKPGKK